MQEIKNTDEKYRVDAMDAIIVDKEMYSGKRGKEIDYEKTYQNMKEYGTYNESLTVQKETIPTISIENHYDKYIIGGNKTNKRVAFVFIGSDNIENIIKVLDSQKIKGTLFIDGTYIEKNIAFLKNHNNHHFELLSYQDGYRESFFKTSISYLESITGHQSRYCYTEDENDVLLQLCKKMGLHTIKPNIIIKNHLYSEIKDKLTNGSIISIHSYNRLERELSMVISYIKEKGYKIVSLEQLLSE